MNNIKAEAFALLKEWCDELIKLQIDLDRKELRGGILCPACSLIHGRCGDLVLPLAYLYSQTADERYLKAAEGVLDYSENNILREDGTYFNDVNSTWRGISAFSALAFGEVLMRLGNALPERFKEKLEKVFLRLSRATVTLFENEIKSPSINYHSGMAALMALAYKYTGEDAFLQLANKYEAMVRAQFNENGLLVGEGISSIVSKKGCQRIDMGYNLEESLPLLITHAHLLGDEEKLGYYTARTLDHLELILPDGAIDNSFGTRMNKWTYYGSRTSDGFVGGFALIAERDPKIQKAILLNFELQKRCTKGGLLHAGLLQFSAKEPPCVHHTFTHAKAITSLCLALNDDIFKNAQDARLTRETDGVRKYQNGNLITVTKGSLTATVNATDSVAKEDSSGGGAISMLYHKKRGPILAATLNTFIPKEPYNMQYLRKSIKTYSMTARFVSADGSYSSDTDISTVLTESCGKITAKSKDHPFEIKYEFESDLAHISLTCGECGEYLLPIISEEGEELIERKNTIIFGENLEISSNTSFEKRLHGEKRFFNQVGGFQYVVLAFKCKQNELLDIKISVK